MRDADAFVPVAEVVRAVGLRGEVRLYHLLDWHDPLLESSFLIWEDGAALRIGRWRPDKNGTVASITGCADRDAAERLVGSRIGFWRGQYLAEEFPKPPGGLPFRYLDRDVRLASGTEVGKVSEVRRYGPQLTLVILAESREILVPAVEPILRFDAGLSGPLIIDPPEGLLDVAGD